MKNFRDLILIFVSVLLVASCTGSNGDLVGSGQQPDPVVVDFPIAFVKRPIPVEMDQAGNPTPVMFELREPVSFNPGAELIIRDRASLSAQDRVLTEGIFEAGALYDVKDLAVSADGSKLLFAMRAPEIENADEDEQPKWNIWEYDVSADNLRRIIASDISAEAGDDVSPQYLPDGRIVFASTRQRQAKAVLLDEGKPQFIALDEDRNVQTLSLHVMSETGENIKQITFNQSHDMHPSVLTNGKVVFSRWDNFAQNNTINLYQVNPDGSQLEILYGRHSHNSGSDNSNVDFIKPREIEDGRLLTALKPSQSNRLGGELAYIDWQNFIDINTQSANASGGSVGQVSATPYDVRTDNEISIGGRFADLFPLFDGTQRMLMSWSPCRITQLDENNQPYSVDCNAENLAQADVQESDPLYGIWIYNPLNQTQLPIVIAEEGIVYHEVVPLAPKQLPSVIPPLSENASNELLDANLGVVHIRSVYDVDGVDVSPLGISAMADPLQSTSADRPARFLRVVKAVSMPDDDLVDLDGTAFGRSQAQLMRDILGYVPIEPDGSVMFKVPADVAFSISIVDANGQRISPRHQNWISVTAGEEKQCNGCHANNSEQPHGRIDAQPSSINLGAAVTGSPFPNTNPALFADEGETMAQVYARINGVRDLSVNIEFIDEWTDPNVRALDPSINYLYQDLTTPSPTNLACMSEWNGLCRITINYIDVIQPLWELPRQTFDSMGNLVSDYTCVSCHSPTDEMDQTRVPLGQLELIGTPSVDEPDQLTSYRELMFNDNELELANGALIDRLEPALDANGNPIYETDADGNLILDDDGNPIPVMNTVNVAASMNVNAARNSQRFFNVFNPGGTHEGWLTDAELKLISEWLDIGGQYYNNPFDVPQ
ncbi:HzsA-related protein [Aliikangiella sp. IMCC44632]